MLTWKLWRALNRSPRHLPLYRRVYLRQEADERPLSVRIPMFWLVKNLSLILLPVALILLGAPIMAILYYLSMLMTPLLLPLANTLYGFVHANNTSGYIARERDHQTYDVICTSPAGTLGMHWSYCAGWLHAHVVYHYLILGLLAIGLFASLFGLPAEMVFGEDGAPLLTVLVRGLSLGILFVLDYAQTMVISSLTAMLVPAYAENESNARLWASSLFLLLQVSVYLPTLLLSSLALPNALALLGVQAAVSAIIVPVLSVVFFAALREIIIAGMWQRVAQQLNTTSVELDALSRAAV